MLLYAQHLWVGPRALLHAPLMCAHAHEMEVDPPTCFEFLFIYAIFDIYELYIWDVCDIYTYIYGIWDIWDIWDIWHMNSKHVVGQDYNMAVILNHGVHVKIVHHGRDFQPRKSALLLLLVSTSS